LPNSREPTRWKTWLIDSFSLRKNSLSHLKPPSGRRGDDLDLIKKFLAQSDEQLEKDASGYMLGDEDPKAAVSEAKQFLGELEKELSVAPEATERSSAPRRPNKRTYLLWGSIFKASFKASAEGPSSPEPKVYRPAGHLAVTVLSFALPKKVYEDVFAQAIADLRDEVNELDLEGKVWQRRWITFLGNCTFGLMVGMVVATGIGRKIFDLWKMV